MPVCGEDPGGRDLVQHCPGKEASTFKLGIESQDNLRLFAFDVGEEIPYNLFLIPPGKGSHLSLGFIEIPDGADDHLIFPWIKASGLNIERENLLADGVLHFGDAWRLGREVIYQEAIIVHNLIRDIRAVLNIAIAVVWIRRIRRLIR